MKRDPALDPFRAPDDLRLLVLDRTFPAKPFARTFGRLELAHGTRPTDSGNTIRASDKVPGTRGRLPPPQEKVHAGGCQDDPRAEPERPV